MYKGTSVYRFLERLQKMPNRIVKLSESLRYYRKKKIYWSLFPFLDNWSFIIFSGPQSRPPLRGSRMEPGFPPHSFPSQLVQTQIPTNTFLKSSDRLNPYRYLWKRTFILQYISFMDTNCQKSQQRKTVNRNLIYWEAWHWTKIQIQSFDDVYRWLKYII